MHFCGEIIYDRGYDESGDSCEGYWVHSDICFNCGSEDAKEITEEHRKFLHDCLDEWLNKSNGTGAFWVGDPMYLVKEFTEES